MSSPCPESAPNAVHTSFPTLISVGIKIAVGIQLLKGKHFAV